MISFKPEPQIIYLLWMQFKEMNHFENSHPFPIKYGANAFAIYRVQYYLYKQSSLLLYCLYKESSARDFSCFVTNVPSISCRWLDGERTPGRSCWC